MFDVLDFNTFWLLFHAGHKLEYAQKSYCFLWWSALPGEETCNVCKKLLNSDNSSKLAEVTVAQVVHAVQHVTQRRIMKKNKGGNTTNGKKNAWTSICNDPLPRKKKK